MKYQWNDFSDTENDFGEREDHGDFAIHELNGYPRKYSFVFRVHLHFVTYTNRHSCHVCSSVCRKNQRQM